MPRKTPLSEPELAIARRLTFWRKMQRFSREELARKCNLTSSLITRVELGIMPLRYEDAILILIPPRSEFQELAAPGNPLWLAYGIDPIQLNWPLGLPRPHQINLPWNISFSDFVSANRKLLEDLTREPPEAGCLPVEWLPHYMLKWATLQSKVATLGTGLAWLEGVTLTSAENQAKLSKQGEALLSQFGEALGAYRENKMLTQPAQFETLPSVKSPRTLSELRKSANSIVSTRGKMKDLARFLKAPYTSVSRWLSGKREPSGETTLKLLNWVEKQERKPKQ